MKNFWFIMAIFLGVLSIHHNAAAFSADDRNYQNNDGSPKFTDPDEQLPGLRVSPDQAETNNRSSSFNDSAVTIPTQGDMNYGATSFDRAFLHQQNKD